MKRYLLFFLTLFLLTSCDFNKTYRNRAQDKLDAEKTTNHFYSLLKENKESQVYELFGDKFFRITPKEQLAKMLKDIGNKCGNKIFNITLEKSESFVSIGTNPKAEYVLLYKIQRNLKNTEEKITLEKVNDSIKIVGYDVSLSK